MKHPRSRCSALPALTAALVAAWCGAARATVEISPIHVTLSGEERSALLTVRNGSSEPARYQVEVFAWSQTTAGESKLAPTQELLAFPRTLAIAPGDKRTVRIGTTVPFGAVERTFRVFLQEMPPPARAGKPGRVEVLSRIGVPVFIAPSQPIEKAVLGRIDVARREAAFALRNLGNVHVRPAWVRAVAEGAGGAVLLQRELEAWYVLANGERQYVVKIPAAVCAGVRAVAVEAAVGSEVLRARLATPKGVCGP